MRDQTPEAFPAGRRSFYCNRNAVERYQNGKLLSSCVENGFDLLLTIDKNMMHQQNLDKFAITLVVLNSITSKIEELKLFLPSFHAQANRLQKHMAYLIDK
jgi:hypothetical protein